MTSLNPGVFLLRTIVQSRLSPFLVQFDVGVAIWRRRSVRVRSCQLSPLVGPQRTERPSQEKYFEKETFSIDVFDLLPAAAALI
ncbi:hypothetical protein A0H81_04767 [Grifola frondosa]|uniref:Uncharacterized protein n=1 Tax=Grifola frondosa TaxID=5627 RepID=A0A1C7MEK9_GRIFR|nr:hypothetical protein A0H81_04767 [Grifola frondosa]